MKNKNKNKNKLITNESELASIGIVAQFEQIVALYGDKIAVEEGSELTSYSALDKLTDQFAAQLTLLGVGENDVVAVCLERSLHLTAVLVAILKCGACYVPLDASAPAKRRADVMTTAEAVYVVSSPSKLDVDEFPNNISYIDVNHLLTSELPEEEVKPFTPSINGLACIFFTSGSTGRPKGVVVEQRGILRLACQPKYVPLPVGVRIGNISNPTFDALTFEVWGALLNGGTLVVFNQQELLNIALLADKIERDQIDVMFITSALFNLLVQLHVTQLAQLKHILIGGEAISTRAIKTFFDVNKAQKDQIEPQLYNAYGPTECTTFALIYPIKRHNMNRYLQAQNIPIGQAIDETQAFIIIEGMRLAEPGEIGEIYLSGKGLARGYCNDEQQTQESFVHLSWLDPDLRLYKTGDIGSVDNQGNIEYLGRVDHQVKIRGHRVELAEIDNQLVGHDSVSMSVTLSVINEIGVTDLHVYLVLHEAVTKVQLRSQILSALPAYMMPHKFFSVDHFPLNNNGKIDKKLLVQMPRAELLSTLDEAVDNLALSSPLWQNLSRVCQQVLGIDEQLVLNESFIEAGGDSLKAMLLASKINKDLDKSVTVGEILQAPSLLELFELLDNKKNTSTASVLNHEVVPLEYLASSQQKRLFFLQSLTPDSAAYNTPFYFEVKGELNETALNVAWSELVSRHEALRTYFDNRDGDIYVVVNSADSDKVEIEKHQCDADQLTRLKHEFGSSPFTIENELLVRAKLFCVDESRVLALCFHHILIDGWSLNVLLEDLSNLYDKQMGLIDAELPILNRSYYHFSQFQQQFKNSNEFALQQSYWRNKTAKLMNTSALFSDDLLTNQQGTMVETTITATDWQTILNTVKREGVTLFSFTMAAMGLLLGRYFDRNSVAIGAPVANRASGDFSEVVGMFANTSVFDFELEPTQSLARYLHGVHRNILEILNHQELDFDDVVALLPSRTRGNPLFDCMLVLENTDPSLLRLGDCHIKAETGFNGEAKFPLTLFISAFESVTTLSLEYKTGLMDKAFANGLITSYQQILMQMTGSLSAVLRPLLDISTDERTMRLVDRSLDPLSESSGQALEPQQNKMISIHEVKKIAKWNDTGTNYPKGNCIHQLFEQQVENNPNAIAVVFEGNELSYAELNRKANQLAYFLVEERAVKPDTLVGLCVERSHEMLIGLLAILKAGGSYVPLDPNYPQARLSYMLQDANLTTIISQQHLSDNAALNGAQVLYLDDETFLQKLACYCPQNLSASQIELTPNNLAYVIYTSGTTGHPKGVMVEHSAAANYLFYASRHYCPDIYASVVSSSLSFDATLTSIFTPLIIGKQVQLTANDKKGLVELIDLIKHATKPLLFKITPSHLDALSGSFDKVENNQLAHVFVVGGEQLHSQTIMHWKTELLPQALFINEFGPTEAVVGCSTQFIQSLSLIDIENRAVPIGKPISNVQLHVLKNDHEQCPINVFGELYIAGVGLARGYLNRSDLTAEKFINNPFYDEGDPNSSKRMYKTGDLVRWLPNGVLAFEGRIDHQVKIRGFRIELEEIEQVLVAHHQVKDAIVLAQENELGNKYLVAYVVMNKPDISNTEKQQNIDLLHQDFISLIRQELHRLLPEYMSPDFFMVMEQLPLTSNQKIDRNALPLPDMQQAFSAGSNDIINTEQSLYKLDEISQVILNTFTEALGFSISVSSNFFEAGVSSLLIMKVHARLQNTSLFRAQSLTIDLLDFFSFSSINSLTVHVFNKLQKPLDVIADDEQTRDTVKFDKADHDIAVIGMSVRLPGADNLAEFWQAVESGKECIESVSLDQNSEENWVAVRSSMNGISDFDPTYFGLSELEASLMDPQQRHALMSAVHALEHAGMAFDANNGKVGVVMCASDNSYYKHIVQHATKDDAPDSFQLSLLNEKDFIATRIAYHLDLKGPALTLQSACSSSLVAIHQACQQLISGDSEVCIAGGVNADLETLNGYRYRQGMILSQDGHCKPFSNEASGTIPANGIGMVVLKPLSKAKADGDRIYAVVKGAAVNNDGKDKVSFFAPSIQGQADVIVQAQKNAGVTSDQISYVEAHGTGTKLGDPIEIKALSQAFKANSSGLKNTTSCALASVKSQLGHLGSAAGVTGFIRTVLGLYHKVLPPSLWSENINPLIDLTEGGFSISAKSKPWDEEQRYAGVSSFGMGGTNAHIILGEGPSEHSTAKAMPNWDALGHQFSCKSYLSKWHLPAADVKNQRPLEDAPEFKQQPASQWLMQEYWFRAQKLAHSDIVNRNFFIIDDDKKMGEGIMTCLEAQGCQVTYLSSMSAFYQQKQVLDSFIEQDFTLINFAFEQSLNNQVSVDGLLSVVKLIQTCSQQASSASIDIINITTGSADVMGDELLHPASALLLGPINTVPLEHHNINYFVVDVLPELAPNTVMNAIGFLNKSASMGIGHYAIRGAYLWSKDYRNVPNVQETPNNNKATIKNNTKGVYVITGGTGGIGQLLTDAYLAKGQTVISLSRSGSVTDFTPEKLLQEFKCDVSQSEDIALVAQKIKAYYGQIEGVIHCAGSAGGTMLHRLDEAILKDSLAAKVQGALNIEAEFLSLQPTFIAYCSSMSAIHGVVGQTDYASANSFLDLHAKKLSQSIKGTRVVSINWPTWKGVGMAAQVDKTDFAITGQEGVTLFDQLINDKSGVQYLVSPLEHQDAKRFFSSLIPKRTATKASLEQKPAAELISQSQNIDPKVFVTQLFKDVLGCSDIEDDDCFYDLGGDSISILDIVDSVNQQFPGRISHVDLVMDVSINRVLELIGQSSMQQSSTQNSIQSNEHIICLKSGDESDGVDIVIHPVGGDLIGYRQYIDAMPSGRAIYGIRDPWLVSGDMDSPANIEAMAAKYLEALDNIKPIRLIGWSFGGFVAWQMVKLLEQKGVKVELIVIDPPALGIIDIVEDLNPDQVFIDELSQKYPELRNKLKADSCVEDIRSALMANSKQSNPNEVGKYIEQVILVCRKNAVALRSFRPEGELLSKTFVYIALKQGSEITPESHIESVESSWQSHIAHPINFHFVEGDHYTILQGENASKLITTMCE